MDPRRVAPAHQLFLLPLHPSLSAGEAVDAVCRLQRAGSVHVVAAAVVHCDGGGWRVDPSPVRADEVLADDAWAWVVSTTVGTAGVTGSGGAPGGGRHDPGLSASFVAEAHDAAAAADGWVVAIVHDLDAGAAVQALRRFPSTRVIYGDLPAPMVDRLEHWSSAAAS